MMLDLLGIRSHGVIGISFLIQCSSGWTELVQIWGSYELFRKWLKRLLAGPITPVVHVEIAQLRKEVEGLAVKEETIWRQQSNDTWLREGNQNTNFFHQRASIRFKTNMIIRARDAVGNWIVNEDDIRQCIVSHIFGVHASSQPRRDDIAKGMENLRRVVDDWMVGDLMQPYTKAECAEREGRLQGISICRGAPSMSHLLFADDTLIFSKASLACTRVIQDILEVYRLGSGIARSKRDLFATIRDKVWARISGWNAKLLSQAGCRWRVASGSHTSVWMDLWILQPCSFKPITPVPPALAPSSPTAAIGSAYHLACSIEEKPCTSSRFAEEASWWRKLWQTKIPCKVKTFVWRACLNALPTGIRLGSCILGSFFVCPFCFDDREDLLHTLAHCSFACQVWGLTHMGIDLCCGSLSSALGWFQSVSRKLEPIAFFLFLCICWSIWWAWNRKVMESEYVAPLQVSTFALYYLESFLNQNVASSCWTTLRIPASWQALPLGTVKINFDGATFAMRPVLGIVVMVRNGSGQCLAWMSLQLDRAGDGKMVEALAACEAIQLACRRGWILVVIEGNCANLVRKLQASERDLSDIDLIVFYIHLLPSSFVSCHFSLVRRSGNSIANFLARSAPRFIEGGSIVPQQSLVCCLRIVRSK
ncbi:UNVERIFIED_CONTAM: hypothetical protein Sradi_0181700 [Sesamum radiatum]|uniref:Reverse transcriptase zinc-binding domain-containing protein n=1 Tax=Sesamum radiatum TaxID=300843 RepID=A0AAW2W086_SESRA